MLRYGPKSPGRSCPGLIEAGSGGSSYISARAISGAKLPGLIEAEPPSPAPVKTRPNLRGEAARPH